MAYQLRAAHLYGDLMNTYGDIGNLLAMRYYAKAVDATIDIDLISLDDAFDPDKYDFVLFGGGQDYEQTIVSKDLQTKKAPLTAYIQAGGPFLAICGGFQMLGHYYIGANGEKIAGIGALDHYTLSQDNNRFIGNITIKNAETGQTYYGFENHNGMTFLGAGERPLGEVEQGHGNNGKDGSEGVIYKNTFGSYFHGPILARNEALAKRILKIALQRKYPDGDWSPLDQLTEDLTKNVVIKP
ncbi:type 1 glutamine amidotransferase [Lactiplantibacillus modestisalitolerans]|uniref:Lipid II isoglutaminyl synthase (glutamine-hydrolyzing) subunit GatD n=1 Tax=Lactiplantibacillus modestisalitolerans TaxID=1457219 RepID=A0ABV5WX36_9LACO|nr:glutamine amidotransferase [Lactiplantibacillus modestisalitolerans]